MVALIESTPPWVAPSRRNAVIAATNAAGLVTADWLTRMMVMAAPGATACTISASSTSSPPAGEAVHHSQPRGGQAEPAVEARHVLADVAGIRCRRLSELRYHHRLAAAVDAALQQRRDAVSGAEHPRRVTRGRRHQAANWLTGRLAAFPRLGGVAAVGRGPATAACGDQAGHCHGAEELLDHGCPPCSAVAGVAELRARLSHLSRPVAANRSCGVAAFGSSTTHAAAFAARTVSIHSAYTFRV